MDHDWKRIMHENEREEKQIEMFDGIDMNHTYSVGFWIGAISGILITISLCLLAGLYYNGWQLPG